MSRFDADLTAAGDASVELEELIVALGGASAPGSERYWAMAQYLSGAEGWRDAGAVLRGAFAGFVLDASETAAGLTSGQEE